MSRSRVHIGSQVLLHFRLGPASVFLFPIDDFDEGRISCPFDLNGSSFDLVDIVNGVRVGDIILGGGGGEGGDEY